jgi:pyrimidine-nucleoside phosphorylase/thymidine phosphorylase
MRPAWIIERKRDGHALTSGEIEFFVHGFTDGSIPDYQMSSLAMAIYFRGMSGPELDALTDAMMRSGTLIDLSSLAAPTADKHSTGGVGDKVSLVLAPLVAACGVAVPMISGRGLGITGGTLDKLESIPGYRTGLSLEEFKSVLQQCGCSMIGQTAEIVPADRKLYALRDVTATVPSIPLIAASIMSKKLAEGAATLVLDVKWGRGAFMKSLADARTLAGTMLEIGRRAGRRMTALITDMNQPLGRTAGNALEVRESLDALRGRGPADLMSVTLELSAEMLCLSGRAADRGSALAQLRAALTDGRAFASFKEMVRLHGGDTGVLDNPDRLPAAPIHRVHPSPQDGFIAQADADLVGRACVALGAGRRKASDPVDHGAGVSGIRKIGERVSKGEPLLTLHGASESAIREASDLLDGAFLIESAPTQEPVLIVEKLTPETIR